MSYVRFGDEGATVYVFESDSGLECCGCNLLDKDAAGRFVSKTRAGMVAHLREHQKAGGTVPQHVFDELEMEQA